MKQATFQQSNEKQVEGKVLRPGSQMWEVKEREREKKKYYLTISTLFLTVGRSAETGGL